MDQFQQCEMSDCYRTADYAFEILGYYGRERILCAGHMSELILARVFDDTEHVTLRRTV